MFDHKKIRNRNLQCLRGVAILSVVLAHALFVFIGPNYISSIFNFTIGVDLFFIISGYLMGLTFLSKIDGVLTLKDAFDFYKKRVKRLFSANLFWSLFIVVFFSIWIKIGVVPNKEVIIWIFLSNITFLSNLFNISHSYAFGYFWTLGTEAQFYLILPLLVFIFRKKLVLGIFGILFILTFLNPFPADIQWLFRWNSLFIGVLIWKFMTQDSYRFIYESLVSWSNIFKICMMFMLFCLIAYFAHINSIGWAAKSTVIGSGLGIIVIIFLSSEILIFGVMSRYIEYIGDISYSWYLCHIPIWLLASYVINYMGLSFPYIIKCFICILVSFVFSILSYRFIERDRRLKFALK